MSPAPTPFAAPDHSAVIYGLAAEPHYAELLRQNTEPAILEFMQEAGARLKAADPQWGFLTKTGGEKHLTLPNGQYIAVDSFCYRATNGVVDTLTNAVDTGPSGPAWQPKPKRDINDWYPISGESSGGGGGGGGTTPPPTGPTEKDHEQDARLAALESKLAALESSAMCYGDHVGLRCDNGTVLCAEDGGPRQDNQPFTLTSRSGVGPWESWLTERGQG